MSLLVSCDGKLLTSCDGKLLVGCPAPPPPLPVCDYTTILATVSGLSVDGVDCWCNGYVYSPGFPKNLVLDAMPVVLGRGTDCYFDGRIGTVEIWTPPNFYETGDCAESVYSHTEELRIRVTGTMQPYMLPGVGYPPGYEPWVIYSSSMGWLWVSEIYNWPMTLQITPLLGPPGWEYYSFYLPATVVAWSNYSNCAPSLPISVTLEAP